MPFGKIDKSKKHPGKPGKTSRLKNAIMVATITVAWLFASCDGNYSWKYWNFGLNPDNPKEVRGRYNVHFKHSEGSAWYNTDNYNIDVIQEGTWYIVQINGKNMYKVNSLKEAEHKICELISDENEGFVHKRYIKKAEEKTVEFMEKFNEYQNNPDRPEERTVPLGNNKK